MSPSRRLEPALFSLLAFLVYALTGAREVLWGDPTKLTIAVYRFQLTLAQWSHVGGLVWSRPFAELPLEPYAWRLHLSSAVASALALGLLHAVLLARVSARAARVGTGAVLVAHTVWYVSAMMESYPVALLVIALATWLFTVPQKPLLGGLTLGMGGLVHHLTLFPLPAVLVLTISRPGGRRAALLTVVGAVAGFVLPSFAVAMLASDGADTEIDAVLGRYASLGYALKNAPLLLLYFAFNFAGPALLLALAGVRRLTSSERLAGLALLAVCYGVALVWLPQRSFLIPLPVYFATAYPIALASERFLETRRRLAVPLLASVLLCPVAAYAVAPAFFGMLRSRFNVRDVAFRQEGHYFLQPWKFGDRSARTYIERVDAATPEGAVLVGDFTTLTPLWYAQRIEHWRPDVTLYTVDHVPVAEVEARLAEWIGEGRRVFFLDDQVFLEPGALARLGRRERVEALSAMTELRP